jgi:hypothetical protein
MLEMLSLTIKKSNCWCLGKGKKKEKEKAVFCDADVCFVSRQRLLEGNTDLEALAYEHLPREYWDQICVSAMGNNYLYPRPR